MRLRNFHVAINRDDYGGSVDGHKQLGINKNIDFNDLCK